MISEHLEALRKSDPELAKRFIDSMKLDTFSPEIDVDRVPYRHFAVVSHNQTTPVEVSVLLTSAAVMYPIGLEGAPYLVMHFNSDPVIPGGRVFEAPENSEDAFFGTLQAYHFGEVIGHQKTIEDVMGDYKEMLSNQFGFEPGEKKIGVYIHSGFRINPVDIIIAVWLQGKNSEFDLMGASFVNPADLKVFPLEGRIQVEPLAGESFIYKIGQRYEHNMSLPKPRSNEPRGRSLFPI